MEIRKAVGQLLLAVALVSLSWPGSAAAQKKPNVLVIFDPGDDPGIALNGHGPGPGTTPYIPTLNGAPQ